MLLYFQPDKNGAVHKIRSAGWVDSFCHFCYDALRKMWKGWGSKWGALRNAKEKIENALIDIASPKPLKKQIGM